MDEVVEKLETTIISPAPIDDKSSFETLYKNWGKLKNQEERRKETLELQKFNRNSKLDQFRGILELVKAVEEKDVFKTNTKSYYRPSIYVAGFHKAAPSYNNVLMLSEWMIEKPEHFSDDWFITPCPKGIRTLIVATQGNTKFYTKYGQFKFECRTALPGGNPLEPKYRNRCCVLDGVYQEKTNTAYILDILAWNSQPMTDGETDFRHYWLQTHFPEIPELLSINKKNKVIFSLLPKEPCTLESLNKFMMSFPLFKDNCPPTDGLLFYHKCAHYVSGVTPLVGWLYPFMVPEVIGSDVTVHKAFLLEQPSDYVNQAEFIQKFEEKQAKKHKAGGARRRRTSNNAMDTTEVDKNEDKMEESKSNVENVEDAKSSQQIDVDTNGHQSTENMDSETSKNLEEMPDAKVVT